MRLRLVEGCPCNEDLAPFIELLRREVAKTHGHATVNSIYRGQDAAAILHAHGKSTQAEIHRKYPALSNPAGRSTHELRSDGVAYAGPVGRGLAWWQQGWDTNDDEVAAWKREAARHGWVVWQPYNRGVEFHHLNFKHQPMAGRTLALRLAYLRRRLPTK